MQLDDRLYKTEHIANGRLRLLEIDPEKCRRIDSSPSSRGDSLLAMPHFIHASATYNLDRRPFDETDR